MSPTGGRPQRPSVHPSDYAMLNERFYRAQPGEYLELRLWSLASTLGDVDPSVEVSFEDFKLGRVAGPAPEQRIRYAALESTVLLHHAAEAMIRLYFAHAKRNRCP